MSTEVERTRVSVEEIANRFQAEMIPLSSKLSYFSTTPMAEEDLRQYVNDPVAAVSPAIHGMLPQMALILAPYLEKGNGKDGDVVSFERPAEARHPCSGLSPLPLGSGRKKPPLHTETR